MQPSFGIWSIGWEYYRLKKGNCEPQNVQTKNNIFFIQWPDDNDIYPPNDSTMGQLIQTLKTERIVAVKNSPKGTQLKLLLTLHGNQKVIFKPKWYERNAIIDGPVYSGKDRFNAEIIGFYLGALLNLRWTPVAVGRKLNMKEIYDKADKLLKRTMTVGGEYTIRSKWWVWKFKSEHWSLLKIICKELVFK